MKIVRLYRWFFSDIIRNRAMWFLSIIFFTGYQVTRLISKSRSLSFLLVSHRYYPFLIVEAQIKKEMPNIISKVDNLLDSRNEDGSLEKVCRRTIVLKWPVAHGSEIEKGVLLISFTTSFSYFWENLDLAKLQKFFTVVLEPSWAGYSVPEILFWTNFKDFPVIIQATGERDYRFIKSLKSNLVPVTFGASNWVDSEVFTPLKDNVKSFDSVYVANYNSIKRHHVYFRAIKKIKNPNYRAALVCGKWGDDKETVSDLINLYGVNHNIEIFEGLSPEELNIILNRSKVNVLLSIKEGSNRSLFEGFFADIPGVALQDNISINKTYVNSHTGELIVEKELPEVLKAFSESERIKNYQPRAWALGNISPLVTTRKLEDVLSALSQERNEKWTRSLYIKVNRPEVCYSKNEDYREQKMTIDDLFKLFHRDSVSDKKISEHLL